MRNMTSMKSTKKMMTNQTLSEHAMTGAELPVEKESRATTPKPRSSSKPATARQAPPTRKARARASQTMTWLHTSLVTGSLLATLVGTNLLARADAATTVDTIELATVDTASMINPALPTAGSVDAQLQIPSLPTNHSALILPPIPTVHSPSVIEVAPANRGTTTAAGGTTGTTTIGNATVQFNLEAIPEVVIPNIATSEIQNVPTMNELLALDLPAIPDMQQSIQQAAQQAAQRSSGSVSRSRSSR